MITKREVAAQSQELVELVRPFFAGRPPEVIGGALLDLMAIWLAGHPKPFRRIQLEIFLATLPDMIDANEREIFGDRGHPGRYDS